MKKNKRALGGFLVGMMVMGIFPCNIFANDTFKLQVQSIPAEDCIRLNWNKPDNTQEYSYMIHQKRPENSEFQTIQAKATVKVLEIYPYISVLKDWTTAHGQEKIMTNSITIESFNNNPSQIWEYDVIVFGFSDSNSSKDITAQGAKEVRIFLDQGRGVLFGHDTIRDVLPNFRSLSDKLNVTVMTNNGDWYRSTEVKITKKGLLTNYPWEIGEVGSILTIPETHTVNQVPHGDVWMRFIDNSKDPGATASDNFYLTTWNNSAMIQTGHSIRPGVTGNYATVDEQRLTVNTLFYLAQLTTDLSWDDRMGQDVEAPNTPQITGVSIDQLQDKLKVSFTTVEDRGSDYSYFIEATGLRDGKKSRTDVETTSIKSGVKGYSVVIDNNPTTIPDSSVDITSTEFEAKVDLTKPVYVHIVAVDNVGNVSEPIHYKYQDTEAPTTPSVLREGNTLKLVAGGDTGTGISRHEFKLNQSNWNSWIKDIDLTELNDGKYTLNLRSIDKAGNNSSEFVYQFDITFLQEKVSQIEEMIKNMINTSEVPSILNEINKIEDESIKTELGKKLQDKIDGVEYREQVIEAEEAIRKAFDNLDRNDLKKSLDLVYKLNPGEERNALIKRLEEIEVAIQEKELIDDIEKVKKDLEVQNLTQEEFEEILGNLEEIKDKINKLPDSSNKGDILDIVGEIEKRQQQKEEDETRRSKAEYYVRLTEGHMREPYITKAHEEISKLPASSYKGNLQNRMVALEEKISKDNDQLIKAVEQAIARAGKYRREIYFKQAETQINKLKEQANKDKYLAMFEKLKAPK